MNDDNRKIKALSQFDKEILGTAHQIERTIELLECDKATAIEIIKLRYLSEISINIEYCK